MNLILQHHDKPELPEVERASVAAMARYAAQVGAVHRRLSGRPFDSRLGHQAQKLAILLPDFDEFDDVAIVDCDIFPAAGLRENLFAHFGHGFHQQGARKRVTAAFPHLTSSTVGFYGGCLYKFGREERRALRSCIEFDELRQFDNLRGGWDEGMMHRLCVLAKIPARYLSDRWSWGSYWPNPQDAFFIHVRHKPTGNRLANFVALKACGIIAEPTP